MSQPIPCAGVIVVDPSGNIVAQLRDDKPNINQPGKASYFAGRQEGSETPAHNALRELHEETNLRLTEADITFFDAYVTTTSHTHEEELLRFFIAKGVDTAGLEVYEGQGAYVVKNADDPLVAPVVKRAFAKWFAERDRILHATMAETDVHRFACTLFITPDGSLFGHLRDDKPGIDSPGKVGGFGGAVEAGESPLQAAVRELEEETNLGLGLDDLEFFTRYIVWRPLTKEYEQASVYLARNVSLAGLKVYEGQGAQQITKQHADIAPAIVPAVIKWFGEHTD